MNTNFPFNRFNFLPLIENIKKEDNKRKVRFSHE